MTESTTAGGTGAADRRRAQALAVLGLPAAATPAEITRRFRELVKATHPDTSPGADGLGDPRAVAPDAGADMGRRMAAICDAYHLLAATAATRGQNQGQGPAQEPAERPAGTQRPAASPVSVPVHRRPSPRSTDRQPLIVAGPVRVQPWRGPAPSAARQDTPDRGAPR